MEYKINIINISKTIGEYRINDILSFTFTKRPSSFHILMTRILLGWKWIDYKEKEQ